MVIFTKILSGIRIWNVFKDWTKYFNIFLAAILMKFSQVCFYILPWIHTYLYCHGHRALLMFTILFESFGNEITKPLICFRVFTRLSVLHTNQMWHFSNQFVTIFHVYMLEVDKIARINLRKSRLDGDASNSNCAYVRN